MYHLLELCRSKAPVTVTHLCICFVLLPYRHQQHVQDFFMPTLVLV